MTWSGPTERVGKGARWYTVHEIEQNGMKLRQTGHYSIVERSSICAGSPPPPSGCGSTCR